MRNFVALAAVAIVAMAAGTAQAVTVNIEFTDNFVGVPLPGTPSGGALDISDLPIGTRFEVGITLDNTGVEDDRPGIDDVQQIFTFLNVDPSVLSIVSSASVAVPILQESGFGGAGPLSVLGAPADAAGQAAGTIVGLAHGTTGAATRAEGPDLAAIAVFEVVGNGISSITQSRANGSVINGLQDDLNAGTFPANINFGSSLLVIVPEPGTAMLMGLGLVGLAAAGRRES